MHEWEIDWKSMRVIGIQFDIAWRDAAANFAAVEGLLASAEPPAGALVVLPEMFATGFCLEPPATAGEQAETESFLSDLAGRFGVYVCAGLVAVGDDDSRRNQAVVINAAGETLSRYTKLHSFTPAGEDKAHTPGEDIVLCRVGDCQLCPTICYDLRFPELFRRATRQGAELFAVIANWPACRGDHWETLLKARAIENQAYIVGVNRCGTDPNHDYAGGSIIVSPRGEVLAAAGDRNQTVSADLDLESLREYRGEFPALNDIREDFFK
jgi:predicted amidohydrolase